MDPSAQAQERERAVATAPRLFRLRLWLVSQLWVPVLSLNLLALALSYLLPKLDNVVRLTAPISIGAVQALYSALAGSMITFTGIVFSAMFIAAQIQTQSYSPRLAAQLRRDPIIMGTLVLSTATAVYSLGALTALDEAATGSSAPLFTVGFGIMLAIATLAWFAALVQRAFENIQIGGILRSLSRQARRSIDDVHPPLESSMTLPRPRLPADAAVAEIEYHGTPGVVAAVDRRALVRLAEAIGGFVEVAPQVGEFVARRSTALRTYDAVREPTLKQVESVFVIARQRTIDQDPAYSLRILVDIAIRALSPAVNDPTTAVQTLDRIEITLVILHERHPGAIYVVDRSGEPRGLVHQPTWTEYFELGVTEIRLYGGHAIQIQRRLRALLHHLLDVVEGEERARVELELAMLDRAARTFENEHDVLVATEADRFGIGGA